MVLPGQDMVSKINRTVDGLVAVLILAGLIACLVASLATGIGNPADGGTLEQSEPPQVSDGWVYINQMPTRYLTFKVSAVRALDYFPEHASTGSPAVDVYGGSKPFRVDFTTESAAINFTKLVQTHTQPPKEK